MPDSQVVYIVDDNPRFLNSVEELLKSHQLTTRSFGSAEEFLESYQPDFRGCLLLDVRLPKMSGIDLLATMRKRGWMIPTIMMTSFAEIPKAVRAMRLGALDFVEKPLGKNVDLISLIRDAMSVEAMAHRAQKEIAEIKSRLEVLVPREREILDLVIDSYSSREIADELGLSVRTVEHYRLGIMKKMGAENLGDLIHKMMRYSVATKLQLLPNSMDSQTAEPVEAAAN